MWRRFWIGGGGALLPLLVTLLAVDLANIIDHFRDYTVGTYVGTGLRYCVLFALGGIVAALNSDEMQPIKLVQLGIAAPALIASYVNAQPAKMPPDQTRPATVQTKPISLDFISSAYAFEETPTLNRSVMMAGFLSDVVQSATRPLPNLNQPNLSQPNTSVPQVPDRAAIDRAIDDARQSAARAAAAAEKAAADAAKLNQESSAATISAVQQSANDSLTASQKATSDVKALNEINTAK